MEREDFTAAVLAHGRAMFRAARACTASDAEAEDAVGEAVLRAWQRADRLRESGAVRAWLVKIAVNCALEARRKTRRETWAEDLETVAGAAPPQEDGDLWAAVCRLAEDRRAAVVLFYYEDLGVREIAKALGVAEGTVKSRLFRARAELKQLLKEEA